MNTRKTRLLYAGGICLVASEIMSCLPSSKSRVEEGENAQHNEFQGSENGDEILEFGQSELSSYFVSVEDPPPMNKEQLEESLKKCNVLTDEPATLGQPPKGSLVFKPYTAEQQLKKMMAVYREDATYEDNFIFLSTTRVIFFHFLLVICFFSQIEVSIKSLDSDVKDSRKCAYIAECTRKYTFRKIPILHYFLPKGISLKAKTMCLVEDGVIVKHQDRYSKVDFSWKRGLPCSKPDWKVYLGNAYSYMLHVFSFFFNLIAYMKTH
eukprot:g5517.t1